MIESEIYVTLDTLFYDTGVTGTTQSSYIIQGNIITKQITDDGTVISYNSDRYGHLFIKSTSPTFQSPLKIEFDIVSFTGESYFNIYDSDGEGRIRLNNTGHYEIIIPVDSNITATRDGNQITVNPNNPIPNLARLSFFLVGTGSTLTFKELKIYPI